jgi:hypothetical protein
MIVYRIRDWSERFENNRTREMKSMLWVPLPNKHDGDGYTDLLDHTDGPAHYGAWVAIVQVASKCEPRGTLLRDTKKPHDIRSISRMTRFPATVIESAIPRLIEIGWLEQLDLTESELTAIPQAPAEKPQGGAPIPHPTDYGTERNGTERKRTGSGVFSKLTAEHLKDTACMVSWHKHASSQSKPIIGSSEADLLFVLTACEKSLEKGDNPPALFASLISQDKRSHVFQAHEDRAKKRLRDYQRTTGPPGNVSAELLSPTALSPPKP